MPDLPPDLAAVIAAGPRAQAAAAADRAVLPTPPQMLELCHKAATVCGTPCGVLTIITATDQTVKAAWGDCPTIHPGDRVDLAMSVCAYVVADNEPLIAPDTLKAPHIKACLALEDVRAYAGAPIHLDGQPIGALAGFGPRPQAFRRGHQIRLRRLADQASRLIAELTHGT
ncbi:MAG: diguanylate cyclase [Solirubrobacterales bacterium]|nr:diguanylate cyclase [Solirubrobacterales bacterium]